MKASEMEKGMVVKVEGKLYTIIGFEHVKLGKGGAIFQTKLKGLVDGLTQNLRIRSEDSIEEVEVEKRAYEYLYSSGNEHVIMDLANYEQMSIDDDMLGDGKKYLKPNMQLQISMFDGKPIVVALPNTVDLEVVDTPPEMKRATATNQNKPATVDTGAVVQVPAFIKIGDIIRIDTRTGEYVTRAK